MQISYDYYRVFYHVAKYHSFTRAAEVLLSNQPNVTRAVKNLESALGCILFVRSNRGVQLTEEGECLYAHIRLAFEHIQRGEEELAFSKSLGSGIVSIGASETALHGNRHSVRSSRPIADYSHRSHHRYPAPRHRHKVREPACFPWCRGRNPL